MAFITFSRAALTAVTISLAVPLAAQKTQSPPPNVALQDAGAYLAGRQAVYGSDFAAAAQYYARALMHDSDNPDLMENLVLSQLSLGQVARALPVAQRMEEMGIRSQAAHMVVAGNLIADEDYAALLTRDFKSQGIGPLIDGLLMAWAHMGEGSVSQALAQFDKVAEEKGLEGFALYHKAMALASVGDYEGAEALFAVLKG